jgi:hypothetical protein
VLCLVFPERLFVFSPLFDLNGCSCSVNTVQGQPCLEGGGGVDSKVAATISGRAPYSGCTKVANVSGDAPRYL